MKSETNFKKGNDFLEALRQYELWGYLAKQDIKNRYRRSKIGPFWMTITMAIFCGALGFVYSHLLGVEIRELLPFLSVGLVVWSLIMGSISEMPTLYVEAAPYIKDIKINLLTILFRAIIRNLIIFIHNILIVIGIYLYFDIWPGWIGLIAIPGFILVLLNIIVIGVPLAILGARFRDVDQIIKSILQVTFFITPIFWFPRALINEGWIIAINPATHYLDLIRSPLLGQYPSPSSWYVGILLFFVFLVLAVQIYKRKSSRVAFWV
jgi:ABC-type polysaccharide/polyol phosphate export permease